MNYVIGSQHTGPQAHRFNEISKSLTNIINDITKNDMYIGFKSTSYSVCEK
jgi:hypothetical protein